jgi:anion-transporting  ArsA/GET3 family ATPase
MAKATETPQEKILANPQGKTVEELKEIAQNLQIQVNQYQNHAVKAQGALEMLLQMIPKEEVEKMIVQETKNNGEASDG